MDTAFARFESARLLSLGYLCKNLSTKEGVNHLRISDLQNVIRDKWHDVNDQSVTKAILQWKRHLAAVAKQNGGPIQHIFC